MHDKDIIYACNEHIEMAIDDFIYKYEEAPEIFKDEDNKCSYCKENAKYKIKLIENNN